MMWKNSLLPRLFLFILLVTSPCEANWRCKARRIIVGATVVAGLVEYTFRPGRDYLRSQAMKDKAIAVPAEIAAQVDSGLKKFKDIRGDSRKRKDYFRRLLTTDIDEGLKTALKNEIASNRLGVLFAEISTAPRQATKNSKLDELYAIEENLYYKLFESREVATVAFSNFHNE